MRREKIDALAVPGQFMEALILENQNFQDLVELYGLEALSTLRSLENISSFLFSGGNYGSGEAILNRVIDLRTEEQGENHSDTLASIASKVGVLYHEGRLSDAERLGLDCLKKCEEHLDPDNVATLRAASNLASIYTSKGELGNAKRLCVKVLEIRQRTLPYDDIDTVRSKVNLSGIYFGQKRWADASLLLESVLTIRRRTLGDGHPLVLKIAKQLEYAYKQLERWKDLQTMQLFILETRIKELGDENDETLDAMVNLVSTYVALEAWFDASEMIEELIKIKKRHPSNHPDIPVLEFYLESILKKIPSPETLTSTDTALVYHPLDPEKHEIRLVYVEKAKMGQALRARLVPVSLDDAPSFEALSYVWGAKQNPGILDLDGHHLDITNNLEAALLQLRSDTQDRLIWIDAISINQKDPKERSEQVQMMREIYSKATKTIVWLGKAEDYSDVAMSFLKELETHPSPEDLAFRTLNTHQDVQDDNLYDSLQSLFKKRAYWRRLWIIQEIVCSNDLVVHCGEHSVTYATMQNLWKVFTNAYRKLDYDTMQRHEKFISKIAWSAPTRTNEKPQAESENRLLLELLVAHKNALCTDLRDRVYGLLGISSLNTSSHPELKIDYTKSPSEVYRGAARAIIEETGSLDVICMSCEAVTRPDTSEYRPRQPYLPTWAPDWNLFDISMPLSVSYPDARASGDSRARFKFSADGKILTAEGLCVAPLDYCSERFEVTNTRYQDMIRCFLGWRLMTQAHLGIHPFQQADPRLDQFYRVITCENAEFDRILQEVKDWWAQWQSQLLQHKSADAIEVTAYQKGYLQLIFDFCAGKRLLYFESPQGCTQPKFKLGLCPNEAKEGDLLCVLLGCNYPVILRPLTDHYVLIGEALVPQYMKGKAVEEMREGSLKAQDFVIH